MAKSKYKIHDDLYPHFLTCTTVNWLKIFKNPDCSKIIIDSLKFLIENNRVRLHAYVIMPDHLHMIASANQLSKQVGNFKSYTARTIIDYFLAQNNRPILDILEKYKKGYKTDQQYQFWQDGSHPQIIYNLKMLEQKINYIHYQGTPDFF